MEVYQGHIFHYFYTFNKFLSAFCYPLKKPTANHKDNRNRPCAEVNNITISQERRNGGLRVR